MAAEKRHWARQKLSRKSHQTKRAIRSGNWTEGGLMGLVDKTLQQHCLWFCSQLAAVQYEMHGCVLENIYVAVLPQKM